jgi:hypothetical protein
MNTRYSNEQLTHIRNQALVYQCACPAHVTVVIDAIRMLHEQQQSCLNESDTDHTVHTRIKQSTLKAHAELEDCLTDILKLEGWDLDTLQMPEYLKKRLLDDI